MLKDKQVIDKLIAKQEKLEMNDTEFSKLLNISRPLWSLNRRGKQPLGQSTLIGAMKAFPALIPDVLKYLQEGNHDPNP